jgi:hypothetical protein
MAADDALTACSLPFVPQLPRRNAGESLLGQAAAPLRGVTVGLGGASLVVDGANVEVTGGIDFDDDRFGGLRAFVDRVRNDSTYPALKAQTAGPVTLAVGLAAAGVEPVLARRLAVEAVTWTVRAMTMVLRLGVPDRVVVLFLDEPSLVLWRHGAEPPWPRVDAVDDLSAVVDAVHQRQAVSGVHICGDGDVAAAVDAGVGIVGVDVSHAEEWRSSIDTVVAGGGLVAWAAVPATGAPFDEDAMARRLHALAPDGRAVVTPTCGQAGAADEPTARDVLRAAERLARHQ